jgi:hypothetical protein
VGRYSGAGKNGCLRSGSNRDRDDFHPGKSVFKPVSFNAASGAQASLTFG